MDTRDIHTSYATRWSLAGLKGIKLCTDKEREALGDQLWQPLCRASDGHTDHCRQSSTKGWVLFCINARTQVDRQRQTQNNTMRRVKQRSAAAPLTLAFVSGEVLYHTKPTRTQLARGKGIHHITSHHNISHRTGVTRQATNASLATTVAHRSVVSCWPLTHTAPLPHVICCLTVRWMLACSSSLYRLCRHSPLQRNVSLSESCYV